MQNNNSKLNTFLLIILVAIGVYIAFFKSTPVNHESDWQNYPTDTTPGLPNTDIEFSTYSGNGISFGYDNKAKVTAGNGQNGPFFNIVHPDRADYPDSISYFPNGLPSNFKMCENLTLNTVYENGKTFHYCDSQGEPVRTYFYGKAGKVVMITVQIMDSYKKLINLGSIEIL